MTLGQLLEDGRKELQAAQIMEWSLDAWYLLEYVTGYTRNDCILRPNLEIGSREEQRYRELIQKRSLHIPLQHLTGSQEFMGLSFVVNENVLIPRQDTEILVETAMEYIHEGMQILDLCTGSGCILLSILKLIPGVAGTGTDLSLEALCTAKENRQRLEVTAELLESSLFEQVNGTYDRILSNPPYIPSGEIEHLMEEVRNHEPHMALDGREDGLYYYRRITEESPAYLKRGGMLFLEIGYNQAEAVKSLMERFFTEIHVVKDLAGLDRVVYGTLKS